MEVVKRTVRADNGKLMSMALDFYIGDQYDFVKTNTFFDGSKYRTKIQADFEFEGEHQIDEMIEEFKFQYKKEIDDA